MSTRIGERRESGHVEVSLPTRSDVLQLVRMVSTVVATRADWAFGDVTDLRLAIDELCASVLAGVGSGDGQARFRLRVGCNWDRESLGVTCHLAARLAASVGRDVLATDARGSALSRQILTTLMDEPHVDAHQGWLRSDAQGSLPDV